MAQKKVLVTGGAGYIGSHVVLELIEGGYEVIVVDNLQKGNEKNLFPGTRFLRGDIQDSEILMQVFSESIHAVFHFAAWKAVGESMTDPEKYTLNNLNGTFTLLVKMLESGCKNLIFSSSAAVYGSPRYLPIDEEHPKSPENYYGYTKLCIEENLSWYARLRGLKYAALRYFNAAGYDPKGRVKGLEMTPANLLPIIMEVATGKREILEIYGDNYETKDGTCIRDYIHVSDLARAHILSLKYLESQGESLIVNLGSESGYSVLEMLEVARSVTGREIPHKVVARRAGDPAKLLASSRKAKEILGWEASLSSKESLIQTMWNVYSDG